MEQLRLVTVIGLKGSGKTSVVEALVSELHARGHEVGTIKTMRHHAVSLDAPDTDTRRHGDAGARIVLALGSDGTARFERGAPPGSLEEVARHFPEDIDILISEGVIDAACPQIVVLCLTDASALTETLEIRGLSRRSVIAVSGRAARRWDASELPGVPCFDVKDPDQRKALAEMILEKMNQQGRREAKN